jgi:hypothetical protein
MDRLHPNCECLDYCDARDPYSPTPVIRGDRNMSAYTDWLKTQSRDTLLSSEIAFYAGMERAAEIVGLFDPDEMFDDTPEEILHRLIKAIRAEIEEEIGD